MRSGEENLQSAALLSKLFRRSAETLALRVTFAAAPKSRRVVLEIWNIMKG